MSANNVSFDDMRKEWIPELSGKLVIDAVLSVVFPIAVACLSESDANGTAIRIVSILVCVFSVPKIAYEVYMYLFEKARGTKDIRTLHDDNVRLRSEIAELRQGQSNLVQGQSNLVLRIDQREADWERLLDRRLDYMESNVMLHINHIGSNLVHRIDRRESNWEPGSSARPGAGNAP